MLPMLRVVFVLIIVKIQGNVGLECYQSSINLFNDEIDFDDKAFVACPLNVSHCISEYVNNGDDFVYRLGCDVDNFCQNENGCSQNFDNWKRTCCCNDSFCVDPDASSPITFTLPKSIQFGAASSATQIEGFDQKHDGSGTSMWKILGHRKDIIRDNSTLDVACDSYHLWRDDIAMLKTLGAESYRFSIAWNRILPNGNPNEINTAGIDYYNQLIDGLIDAGIKPIVTIFHLDYPQALLDRGGWLNEAIIESFANYARILFTNYGDRVKTWITINEPLVMAIIESNCGVYGFDRFTDLGLCEAGLFFRGYTLLMAHAKAVDLFRREFSHQNGKIGIALNGLFPFPASGDNDNLKAARKMLEFEFFCFSDPLVFGDFPPLLKTRLYNVSINGHYRSASRMPELTTEEKQLLKGSVDFISLIYYSSTILEYAEYDYEHMFLNYSLSKDIGVNNEMQQRGYMPSGLRSLLNAFKDRYPDVPLMIAENGAVDIDGEGLNDVNRIRYLRGHLAAVSQAVTIDGVNLTDYLVWSLMDNWEWMSGYKVKMGLFHVDFASKNKTRTPKQSVFFYKNIIQSRTMKGFGPSDSV